MANDEYLAETGGARPTGGGLMTVTDGVESHHPVGVRRVHYGSPLSIELVEPIQRAPGTGEAR